MARIKNPATNPTIIPVGTAKNISNGNKEKVAILSKIKLATNSCAKLWAMAPTRLRPIKLKEFPAILYRADISAQLKIAPAKLMANPGLIIPVLKREPRIVLPTATEKAVFGPKSIITVRVTILARPSFAPVTGMGGSIPSTIWRMDAIVINIAVITKRRVILRPA